MKKTTFFAAAIFAIVAYPSAAFLSDFSGTWYVDNDPQECVVINQQGESVKAEFFHGGTKTADLIGYQKGASIALGFQNSKGEIGAWMAVSNTIGRMDATCLNPDGSLRWKATYIKK